MKRSVAVWVVVALLGAGIGAAAAQPPPPPNPEHAPLSVVLFEDYIPTILNHSKFCLDLWPLQISLCPVGFDLGTIGVNAARLYFDVGGRAGFVMMPA